MSKNNFWKNKKVFITGHTGFKGCWLAIILLNFGAQIKGYSLKPEKNSLYNDINLSKKINSKYGDIRDINILKKEINNFKPEFLFHLAAQPLVLNSYKVATIGWNMRAWGFLFIITTVLIAIFKVEKPFLKNQSMERIQTEVS